MSSRAAAAPHHISHAGPWDIEVADTLYSVGVCVRRRASGASTGGGGAGGSREPEIESLFRRALEIYEVDEDDSICNIRSRPDGHISSSDNGGDSDGSGRKLRPSDDKENIKITSAAAPGASKTRDDERVAAASHELGMCILGKPGRQAEAVQLLKRALQIRESRLGPDDVQVAYTLHDVALCVGEAGSHVEAEELFRRALRIKEEKLGKYTCVIRLTRNFGYISRPTIGGVTFYGA